ncbi:S-layer homology domain-containing protein [Citricoccus nitrophenolicus]
MSHSPHRHRAVRTRMIAGLAAVVATVSLAGAVPAVTPATAATAKTCATPDFRDVPGTSTFYEAITWLRCEQISAGYADGTYAPGQHITRGETAQLLYRFSGESHNPDTRVDFQDVPANRSAFTAVSWMKSKGYTQGYANGTFGVDQRISRGELAAFLYRMSGEAEPSLSTPPFTDMQASDTFYAPAAWFHTTGLVTGYADGSFRPHREVTRGETAKFLYAMESYVHGTPPVYTVPAASYGSAVNATGGQGGTYQDSQSVTYSNGASTSQYHLYADHLDGAKPHGIIVHLHGDGAMEYHHPQWTTIPAYVELARQHNLMLVVPRTPDRTGSITWWEDDASGTYAADLFSHLGTEYSLDLNQVYWTGYSGGAESITYDMMDAYSDRWTGGAAVIVGGGGASTWRTPILPISASLKTNFSMHWVAGGDDTPAAGGSSGSFDAVKAARSGEAHYRKQGVRTSLTVVPGLDHWEIAPHGPAKLAHILASR